MGWIKKLKKDVRVLLKGPGHSPAGKKYIKQQEAQGMKFKKGKVKKTIATEGVERRLRYAGLTEEEIARLR